MTAVLGRVWAASGLAAVWATGPDAWLIIAARSGRMLAYGASALVLALFFAELQMSDARIGLFMTLTLVGDVALSLLLTLVADRWGRRRTLVLGSVLMVLSGATFALAENYWLLLAAAVLGVISATGGDFGPFRAVEESMVSEVTTPATRADVLAWYVTTSLLGSALGTALAGHAVHVLHDGARAWPLLRAYHACFWAYAFMGAVNLVLCLLLSPQTELRGRRPHADHVPLPTSDPAAADGHKDGDDNDGEDDDDGDDDDDDDDKSEGEGERAGRAGCFSRFSQISAKTRSVMYGLWFLLMVDALADGMASMALTTYYLDTVFHASKDTLGSVLSASYVLAAASAVFAGPLTRAIGLVHTMVFTHVPSSAAVLLFPLASRAWLAYALLVLRVGLNNLDQAPRAALIAAVVRPEERTAVMGITSLLRTLASTTGPSLTGLLAGHGRFWIAFVVAGALRLAYDLGLFVMFVNIRLYQYEEVPDSSGGQPSHDAAHADVLRDPEAFELDEEGGQRGGRQ